ncbi:MAG: ligase-associated DNA damage response exonuclease [Hyphomicrobium aestuarii]|nr:ligase-associated DNA damage response exonuclease [Hyphomicrobium aestuarii]
MAVTPTAAGHPRPAVDTWLYPTDKGLWCEPGQFHIDPRWPVDKAVITHGHADHARSGHGAVLATPETIAIMKVRYGAACAGNFDAVGYGESRTINGVNVRLVPAGHILGSAQIVMDWGGSRAVVSGDYKRAADPTCAAFEPIACDVFVTEATFGLPVFRHGNAASEAARLVSSIAEQPGRAHLVGVYGLGKCQRMIKLVRQAGYDAPIYLHGAHVGLTRLYQDLGHDLGDVRPVSDASKPETATALVMCPPSALADRWSRRFTEPVTAFASGWMHTRGRVRQSGVELPLVVSDHADWPELLETVRDTGAPEIWVTHGREDALIHQLGLMGLRGRALALVGREEEGE